MYNSWYIWSSTFIFNILAQHFAMHHAHLKYFESKNLVLMKVLKSLSHYMIIKFNIWTQLFAYKFANIKVMNIFLKKTDTFLQFCSIIPLWCFLIWKRRIVACYTRARICLAQMGRDFTARKTVVKLSHQTTYKTGSKWALNV